MPAAAGRGASNPKPPAWSAGLTRAAPPPQVAHKYMPMSSVIVGIDLVPIKPIRGVITLTEDITTERCRSAIKKARDTPMLRSAPAPPGVMRRDASAGVVNLRRGRGIRAAQRGGCGCGG